MSIYGPQFNSILLVSEIPGPIDPQYFLKEYVHRSKEKIFWLR